MFNKFLENTKSYLNTQQDENNDKIEQTRKILEEKDNIIKAKTNNIKTLTKETKELREKVCILQTNITDLENSIKNEKEKIVKLKDELNNKDKIISDLKNNDNKIEKPNNIIQDNKNDILNDVKISHESLLNNFKDILKSSFEFYKIDYSKSLESNIQNIHNLLLDTNEDKNLEFDSENSSYNSNLNSNEEFNKIFQDSINNINTLIQNKITEKINDIKNSIKETLEENKKIYKHKIHNIKEYPVQINEIVETFEFNKYVKLNVNSKKLESVSGLEKDDIKNLNIYSFNSDIHIKEFSINNNIHNKLSISDLQNNTNFNQTSSTLNTNNYESKDEGNKKKRRRKRKSKKQTSPLEDNDEEDNQEDNIIDNNNNNNNTKETNEIEENKNNLLNINFYTGFYFEIKNKKNVDKIKDNSLEEYLIDIDKKSISSNLNELLINNFCKNVTSIDCLMDDNNNNFLKKINTNNFLNTDKDEFENNILNIKNNVEIIGSKIIEEKITYYKELLKKNYDSLINKTNNNIKEQFNKSNLNNQEMIKNCFNELDISIKNKINLDFNKINNLLEKIKEEILINSKNNTIFENETLKKNNLDNLTKINELESNIIIQKNTINQLKEDATKLTKDNEDVINNLNNKITDLENYLRLKDNEFENLLEQNTEHLENKELLLNELSSVKQILKYVLSSILIDNIFKNEFDDIANNYLNTKFNNDITKDKLMLIEKCNKLVNKAHYYNSFKLLKLYFKKLDIQTVSNSKKELTLTTTSNYTILKDIFNNNDNSYLINNLYLFLDSFDKSIDKLTQKYGEIYEPEEISYLIYNFNKVILDHIETKHIDQSKIFIENEKSLLSKTKELEEYRSINHKLTNENNDLSTKVKKLSLSNEQFIKDANENQVKIDQLSSKVDLYKVENSDLINKINEKTKIEKESQLKLNKLNFMYDDITKKLKSMSEYKEKYEELFKDISKKENEITKLSNNYKELNEIIENNRLKHDNEIQLHQFNISELSESNRKYIDLIEEVNEELNKYKNNDKITLDLSEKNELDKRLFELDLENKHLKETREKMKKYCDEILEKTKLELADKKYLIDRRVVSNHVLKYFDKNTDWKIKGFIIETLANIFEYNNEERNKIGLAPSKYNKVNNSTSDIDSGKHLDTGSNNLASAEDKLNKLSNLLYDSILNE